MPSPANAATGFVPNVEYTRLNQTMSGLNFADRGQDTQGISHGTDAPTAANRKARQFGANRTASGAYVVTKNCEVDILTAELIGKMKAVFAEMVPAGRKGCDEANSH